MTSTHRGCTLAALAILMGCNYRPPPTGPTTVTTTTTVTVSNNPTPTPTPTGGTGTPTGGTRVGDPTTGGSLPLPSYGSQVLQAYAASAAGAANLDASCASRGGTQPWAFVDGLIDILRRQDTRWGYACKRGNCGDIATDVVSYHATAGPDVTGAAGVINVDVMEDFCGFHQNPQWMPFAFDATALWSSRGRF